MRLEPGWGLSMYILRVCVLYVYVNHIGQNVTKSLVPMSKERESVTHLNLVLNEQSVNEHFGLHILTVQKVQIKLRKCYWGWPCLFTKA